MAQLLVIVVFCASLIAALAQPTVARPSNLNRNLAVSSGENEEEREQPLVVQELDGDEEAALRAVLGRVTDAELQHMVATWDALDANADGAVSMAELFSLMSELQRHREDRRRQQALAITAARQKQMRAEFAEMDTDANGKISQAEYRAHMEANLADKIAQVYEAVDTDEDGEVDLDELLLSAK